MEKGFLSGMANTNMMGSFKRDNSMGRDSSNSKVEYILGNGTTAHKLESLK